ncbi:MAG: ABC-F family ATP-binding cassette domain-containing protein, partial [Eubacteriales bacterium]|nr:ABC-F family ATP-binding cassette domain-containing protein [Eubacteriales bacterium]
TIYEEVMKSKESLSKMEDELRSLEAKMRLHSDNEFALNDVYKRYSDLSHRFESEGGYAVKSNVVGILKGLGFGEDEFDKKVSVLSGGQKTRLMLSKLLIDAPELLILDEPTNHLDIASVSWLETYIKNLRTAVIIVSHDRYFLDRIVNKVFDIDNTKGRLYTGTYTQFSEKKALLRKDMMKAWMNNQAAIKHQEEVIEKLRRFNREKSIKRARSREKVLDKMERVEKPFNADDAMKLHFTPYRTSGNDVLFAENLSKSFNGKTLFEGVSLDVKRKEKLCIIGPNGTGKTTLLKILNTRAIEEGIASSESSQVSERHCDPDSGDIEFGTRVEIAYYDQEHQVLDPENTCFDEISDAYPYMNNTEIRNLLASFLFTGDAVFKQVKELSGGERGRLSLAKRMLTQANLLLLDEPTNHLDITSREILEEAVRNYEGTVICVSHDRYFINKTATRILELNNHSFINYIGNYDYYLEKKADPDFDPLKSISGEASKSTPAPGAVADNKKADELKEYMRKENERRELSYEEQKERRTARQKLTTSLKAVEKEIERLEQEDGEIDELMTHPEIATNSAKLNELTKRKNEIAEVLTADYEKWETISMEIEEFDNE